MDKNITIEVQGGIVVDVVGLPVGFTHEVKDLDDSPNY